MRLLKNAILLFSIAAGFCFMGFKSKTNNSEEPVVKTTAGQVSGSFNESVYAFKGIPYAKAERFMPPQDPEAWSGIRACKNFGPVARQVS